MHGWQIGNALGCDPSLCGFKFRPMPLKII
jgi:hypothetical protein